MNLDASAVEHFRQGRDALLRQRDEIDAAIVSVDQILSVLFTDEGQSSVSQGVRTSRQVEAGTTPEPRPGGTRAVLLESMADGKERRVSTLLPDLRARGIQSPENSVRSMLTKMVRDGLLVNPSRGVYRLAVTSAPTTTGAASADTEAAPVLPALEKEGGPGSNGQAFALDAVGANHPRSDTHASVPDRGAPVVGFPD